MGAGSFWSLMVLVVVTVFLAAVLVLVAVLKLLIERCLEKCAVLEENWGMVVDGSMEWGGGEMRKERGELLCCVARKNQRESSERRILVFISPMSTSSEVGHNRRGAALWWHGYIIMKERRQKFLQHFSLVYYHLIMGAWGCGADQLLALASFTCSLIHDATTINDTNNYYFHYGRD